MATTNLGHDFEAEGLQEGEGQDVWRRGGKGNEKAVH